MKTSIGTIFKAIGKRLDALIGRAMFIFYAVLALAYFKPDIKPAAVWMVCFIGGVILLRLTVRDFPNMLAVVKEIRAALKEGASK